MKKKLNVYFSANLIDNNIIKFLNQKFIINVIEFSKQELQNIYEINNYQKLKDLDLIIFTGGEDVDPYYYCQLKGKFTNINKKRDDLEFGFLNNPEFSSIIRNIPKLGICRGAQLLTVYNGGSLIQHVTGHNNTEDSIEIISSNESNSVKIKITGDHHQMMFPYNLKKQEYSVIGWSEKFQSTTYLNDKNEEIVLPLNFLEPEIVFYPKKNSLCIQSHPEWCISSEGSDKCLELIDNYLINRNIPNNKEIFLKKLYNIEELL